MRRASPFVSGSFDWFGERRGLTTSECASGSSSLPLGTWAKAALNRDSGCGLRESVADLLGHAHPALFFFADACAGTLRVGLALARQRVGDGLQPPTALDRRLLRAILNVRDLASHQQLFWLAVAHRDAAMVMKALGALFAEHSAPLVMNGDNAPAFRACATKRLLLEWNTFTLYLPPY